MRGAQCVFLKQQIIRQIYLQQICVTLITFTDRFLFLALKKKKKKKKKKWRDKDKSLEDRYGFDFIVERVALQLSTQGKNFILFLFVPLSRNEDTAGYLARDARESKTGDNAGLFLEARIHIRARKQRSPRATTTKIEKSHLADCGSGIDKGKGTGENCLHRHGHPFASSVSLPVSVDKG